MSKGGIPPRGPWSHSTVESSPCFGLRFVSNRDWAQKGVEIGQRLVTLLNIESKPQLMIQCKPRTLGPRLVSSLGLCTGPGSGLLSVTEHVSERTTLHRQHRLEDSHSVNCPSGWGKWPLLSKARIYYFIALLQGPLLWGVLSHLPSYLYVTLNWEIKSDSAFTARLQELWVIQELQLIISWHFPLYK